MLTFTPDRAMSPHEFAVRTWMQFFEIGREEAEARVKAAEAGSGPGQGPHYLNGVSEAEVGKAIKVGFELPGRAPEEVEDAKARAGELASLPPAERTAIDQEADRRFWQRTGMAPGTKLTAGAADAANRELWMRTRDAVVADRNRVDALPARIHQFLVPDGKQLTPEQYAAVLRIAEKLKTFSDDDWSLYTRRVNASTDDYGRLEQSIDRFRNQQAAERKVVGRVAGTEALYAQVKAWKELDKQYYAMGVGGGATASQSPQFSKRYHDATDALDQALHAAGFADVAAYDLACAGYLALFEQRGAELTMLALRAGEQVVRSELARYQTTAGGQAAFDQLAHLRELWARLMDAAWRSEPTHHMGVGGGVGWMTRARRRKRPHTPSGSMSTPTSPPSAPGLAEQSPILKDPELRWACWRARPTLPSWVSACAEMPRSDWPTSAGRAGE